MVGDDSRRRNNSLIMSIQQRDTNSAKKKLREKKLGIVNANKKEKLKRKESVGS
jgi:hypothetical protein